ncbi:MAG: hypothetical protein JST04_00835 [Bdellovibrionales bacterium]|nr:hypothetical protein [Bdellovibrionales bacterium]
MILRVEIPNYIRKVRLSESQNAKYWEWDGKTIKCGSKKLPKKYINPKYKDEIIKLNGNVQPHHLIGSFAIGLYRNNKFVEIPAYPPYFPTKIKEGDKYLLVDTYNLPRIEKVIANDKKVGTPREMVINGQAIYNGLMSAHVRGKIMQEIKKSFAPHIEALPIIIDYPVRIKCYLFDTVKNSFDNGKDLESQGQRWDIGNRIYPYSKAFLDLLTTGTDGTNQIFLPKLVDDDRLRVTEDPQGGIFVPIEQGEIPKLVFMIVPDDENYLEALRPIEEERLAKLKSNKHYAKASTGSDIQI